MRFRIHLNIEKTRFGNRLPFNYQYELSSCIYHILATGNKDYAEWLHQNGFTVAGKTFRLFVFSPLIMDKIAIEKETNRMVLMSDKAELMISFLPERSTEEFVKGIFHEQTFSLGDRLSKVQFCITGVEMLPPPELFGEITARTLSPICLSGKNQEGQLHYYSAADAGAGQAIFNNLASKYLAFYEKPFAGDSSFEWQILDEPRTKLITIKVGTPQETRIRGSLCRFRLKADNELLRIAYETGIGEKGSQGFGMIEEE